MKKQLLTFAIAMCTTSPIQYILCMDNKQTNYPPLIDKNLDIKITSDIELSQNDINECTKELKEKYNDIRNMKKEDHELLREGIIDASIVIAQAKNNDTQELLSLRKKLYKQYKKLKPVGEKPMDYDYLYGIMKIDNTEKNKEKDSEDTQNRLLTKKSHQYTIHQAREKIEDYKYKINKLIIEKEHLIQRAHTLNNEIKVISLIQHIANLNQKSNFNNEN